MQLDYNEQIYDDIIEESIQLQPEEYNAVTIESLIKDENKAMLPQIADDPNSQSTNSNEQHSSTDVSEPEQPASPIANQTIETPVNETPPKLICPNGWYDENQPCDWIPDNLKPIDELGRSVPSFSTSKEAWNWGEIKMYDHSSNWYLCGFTKM